MSSWIQQLKSENIVDLEVAIKEQLPKFRNIVNGTVDAQLSEESEFVQAYLKQSNELQELFDIWNFQIANQALQLECLVLDVITYAIFCSKLVGNRSIGTIAVRKCIREYMPTIFRNLNSGKHVLIQSTLRLLVALVMHGSNTTKELLDHFNFTLKSLGSFLKIRKKYHHGDKPEDIRTLYIRFIFGFIIRGDSFVKQSILETNNLIAPIFKDLKEDPFWTVDFVLSVLNRGIVQDSKLSKTTKISALNHHTMETLAQLYQCKEGQPKNELNGKTIADCVHSFMHQLCCSQKLYLTNEGWGTFQEQGTQKYSYSNVLLKLVQQLKIVEDPLQKDLLLEIFAANPDLVYHYWQNAQHFSFEPRSSIHFLANVAMATSVIRLSVPESLGCKVDDFSPILPPSIAHSLSNVIPQPLTKVILSKALQFTARDVRFAAGQLLFASFQKLDATLAEANRVIEALRGKDHFTENQDALKLWQGWKVKLLSEFRQHLPDTQVIIALHKSSVQVPQEDDSLTVEDMQLVHLRLLKYYQVYNTDQMRESRYDFGKLIPVDQNSWSQAVQMHFLELLSTVNNFKWWSKSTESQKTHIRFLLESYLNSDNELEQKLESLFVSLFSSTYLFQRHAWFIPVLFQTFKKLKSEALLHSFESLLAAFGQNPFSVVDQCLEFCQSLQSDQIYIDESNLPVASIIVLMSKSFSEPHFLSALMLEQCMQSRDSRTAAILLRLQSNTESAVLKKSYDWIESKITVDFVMTKESKEITSFKKFKKAIDEESNLSRVIFRTSPSTFSGHWKDLSESFENEMALITLFTRLCGDDIHGDVLEVINVLPSSFSWLLELLFLESNWNQENDKIVSVLDERIKSFLDEQVVEGQDLVSQVCTVLFFCYTWLSRNQSSCRPVCLALNYLEILLLGGSTETLQLVSKLILTHPLVETYFLSTIDNTEFQNALVSIVSLCTRYNKSELMKQKVLKSLETAIKSNSFAPFLLKAFKEISELLSQKELAKLYPLCETNGKVNPEFIDAWLKVSKEQCMDQVEPLTGMIGNALDNKEPISQVLVDIVKASPSLSIKLSESITEPTFKRLLKSKNESDFLFGTWLAMHSESLALFMADWVTDRSLDFEKVKYAIAAFGGHLFHQDWVLKEESSLELQKVTKSLCKLHIDVFILEFKEFFDDETKIINDQSLYVIAAFLNFSSKAPKKMRKIVDQYLMQPLANPANLFKFVQLLSTSIPEILALGIWVICSYLQLQKKKAFESDSEKQIFKEAMALIQYLEKELDSKPMSNPELLSKTFMTCLKYQITNPTVLKFMSVLVKGVSLDDKLKYLSMITTHSAFVPILKGSKRENSLSPIPVTHPAKTSLLELIYTVMNENPKQLCQVDHLKLIMTYYYGTVHESDQKAISIFQLFEKTGISVAPYTSLWGNQSGSSSESLNLNESLNQVDSTWMFHSIHWMSVTPTKLYSSGLPCLYDMNFFLAVISTILDQKIGTVDPRRMIESNVVGMVIVGLSHESLAVRKTCHYILAEFHQLLNEGDTKERNQVLMLLNMLKNAIVPTQENSHPILPSLITMFFAHAINVLIKPESYLYPLVNKFTLQRSIVDLEDVPMFYELFYSANQDNRMERMWMLKLLLHGLGTPKDYSIFKRRHVIEILFGYFHSPIADIPGRKLVLQIIYKASMNPSIISSMVTKSGLLQFFSQCSTRLIFQRSNDITLGLPRLVLQVLKGFLSSPVEWDGPVDRSVWLQQFATLAMSLVGRISEMQLVSIEWELNVIVRVLELVQYLRSLDQQFELITEQDFSGIENAIEKLQTAQNQLIQDEFDIDSLFKTIPTPNAVYLCKKLIAKLKQ